MAPHHGWRIWITVYLLYALAMFAFFYGGSGGLHTIPGLTFAAECTLISHLGPLVVLTEPETCSRLFGELYSLAGFCLITLVGFAIMSTHLWRRTVFGAVTSSVGTVVWLTLRAFGTLGQLD